MAAGSAQRMQEIGSPAAPERGAEYISRVREIAPALAAASAEIDAERSLPEPIIDALVERGLLRMLLPRSLGGAELLPAEYVPVIEELAKIDASAAWCVNQNSGCSMTAVHLSPKSRARFSGARAASWPGGRDRARRASRRADTGSPRAGPSPAAASSRAGSAAMCRSSRRTESRAACRRHAGRAHDAVPEKRDQIHRYVAHDRAARHGQQPVFGQGFVRAGGLFGRCPVAPRHVPAGETEPAVPLQQSAALRRRVRRGGARHRPRDARTFHRAGA